MSNLINFNGTKEILCPMTIVLMVPNSKGSESINNTAIIPHYKDATGILENNKEIWYRMFKVWIGTNRKVTVARRMKILKIASHFF